MKIIGLTGGIAMGKSTAASMLRRLGLPVYDSDAAVHRLYARGGAAVPGVGALYPNVIADGAVDRAKLRAVVLGNPEALKRLERLVHPLVRAQSNRWVAQQRRRRTAQVVLDIPLLFETGRDREVDTIWVMTCPAFIQRQRALARPGMETQTLRALLARQMPQDQRLRQADRVFQTGNGKAALYRDLRRALNL